MKNPTPKYKALYKDVNTKLVECVGHLLAAYTKINKLEDQVRDLAILNTNLQETVNKQTAALLKFTPDKQDKSKPVK